MAHGATYNGKWSFEEFYDRSHNQEDNSNADGDVIIDDMDPATTLPNDAEVCNGDERDISRDIAVYVKYNERYGTYTFEYLSKLDDSPQTFKMVVDNKEKDWTL
ncbi:hypothetical protein SARC_00593 [Sphaeroforma arctica JP610]|uniref:Uncharacterized protein n=1 Tax=Sphaeroforma arctica JP610 TaxID=667725 RepID=A0A0L0GEE1_9EUKA|nr:hypothetical protein SARC_00593 [Sphaeroforma arctica JP610]KNC87264.1 hypothetical protein SARC_00593 [Sphaeroforma arctica JP610]|eukprot:XP_014161166.1 hypothetical protein SARC_00593 [Sphaeroforma arctica JP610]